MGLCLSAPRSSGSRAQQRSRPYLQRDDVKAPPAPAASAAPPPRPSCEKELAQWCTRVEERARALDADPGSAERRQALLDELDRGAALRPGESGEDVWWDAVSACTRYDRIFGMVLAHVSKLCESPKTRAAMLHLLSAARLLYLQRDAEATAAVDEAFDDAKDPQEESFLLYGFAIRNRCPLAAARLYERAQTRIRSLAVYPEGACQKDVQDEEGDAKEALGASALQKDRSRVRGMEMQLVMQGAEQMLGALLRPRLPGNDGARAAMSSSWGALVEQLARGMRYLLEREAEAPLPDTHSVLWELLRGEHRTVVALDCTFASVQLSPLRTLVWMLCLHDTAASDAAAASATEQPTSLAAAFAQQLLGSKRLPLLLEGAENECALLYDLLASAAATNHAALLERVLQWRRGFSSLAVVEAFVADSAAAGKLYEATQRTLLSVYRRCTPPLRALFHAHYDFPDPEYLLNKYGAAALSFSKQCL